MESVRHYISNLLFERKLNCAEYVMKEYFDALDAPSKIFLRKIIMTKTILDDIKQKFPINILSSCGGSSSGESTESDDDVDEETIAYKIEELKKQKKRLADRIYLLKKRHQYTEETPQTVFGDN